MTRLISVCTKPTVAAKIAVVAPTMVTTLRANWLVSNKGDRRQTINTPAVTMVAAWISADTGVGPSIASGNQVCRPNCADLPIAPMNNNIHSKLIVSTRKPRKPMLEPTLSGAAASISGMETVPNNQNMPKIPSMKPRSPTRLTTNALIAAAFALGFLYQKPISK